MGHPYRKHARRTQRSLAITNAVRIRNALAARPTFYNVAPSVGSSQDIIDALSACIDYIAELP